VKKFIVLSFLAMSSVVFGQSEAAFFNAFKSGDTQSMDIYLENNIDFCIYEDQQVLSKKDALSKLKTFLASQKITGLEVIHKGTSKDKKSQYKVAKVTTTKEVFRVFVYGTGEFKANSVKEIRIDKF
jgi:Domain of unknown function (DUF4783)